MTKQALRRSRRVEAILESAIAAFRRHGYHGTSMEEIADQLLMTKGSLYYYFKDKEEILFAAHDQALDRLLGELERANRRGGCPCERLETLLRAHIRIMVEGFHGTALALEFGALSPRRLERVVSKRNLYEHALRDLVASGARDGCFRPVDPRMTVFALLGSINWIARWYDPQGPAGAEEVAERFLDHFRGGLLPRGAAWEKGHRFRTAPAHASASAAAGSGASTLRPRQPSIGARSGARARPSPRRRRTTDPSAIEDSHRAPRRRT